MNALDLMALTKLARTDALARHILADMWHERGRDDVARLCADQLPEAPRKRRRLDKLTKAQTAAMAGWATKWIAIGLSTERADRPLFEAGVAACYRAAGLQAPPVIWCPSPVVTALAGPIATQLIAQRRGDAVHGAVRDAVGGAVHGAVHDAVRGAVGGAVGDAVRDAVGGAVRDAVGDAVRGAVRGAVGDAVGDAVRGAVRGAVGGAVGDAVRDAVRDAVGGAVGGAVRDAVGDAVGGALSLTEANLEWWRYMGGQFWVGGWYWLGSPSIVSFLLDVCGLRIDPKIELTARAYAATASSACWWWPHSHFVMVSERPSVIEFHDAEKRRLKRAQWEGWKVEREA